MGLFQSLFGKKSAQAQAPTRRPAATSSREPAQLQHITESVTRYAEALAKTMPRQAVCDEAIIVWKRSCDSQGHVEYETLCEDTLLFWTWTEFVWGTTEALLEQAGPHPWNARATIHFSALDGVMKRMCSDEDLRLHIAPIGFAGERYAAWAHLTEQLIAWSPEMGAQGKQDFQRWELDPRNFDGRALHVFRETLSNYLKSAQETDYAELRRAVAFLEERKASRPDHPVRQMVESIAPYAEALAGTMPRQAVCDETLVLWMRLCNVKDLAMQGLTGQAILFWTWGVFVWGATEALLERTAPEIQDRQLRMARIVDVHCSVLDRVMKRICNDGDLILHIAPLGFIGERSLAFLHLKMALLNTDWHEQLVEQGKQDFHRWQLNPNTFDGHALEASREALSNYIATQNDTDLPKL